MSPFKLYTLFIFLAVAFFQTSCTSTKDITYFQSLKNENEHPANENNKLTLQPGDLLSVTVTSLNEQASGLFNTSVKNVNATSVPEGYFIDEAGYIELPLTGKIKIGGYTIDAAKDSIRWRLNKYLTEPFVHLKLVNFRVTILGEVAKPGVYPVYHNKISLPEALGLANDITIYGRRDNVLLIREADGKKTYTYIDITSRDFFKSPYYYLKQNDILYIEPRKGKSASAKNENFYRIAPTVLGVLTLLSVILSRNF